MEMLIGILALALAGNPANSLLGHPPRDLASLLEPKAVLQKMEVELTEESLIAVLNAKAEAPDAEAGDTHYVKKLMAVRALEQSKSARALPALNALAKGADVTLRDAAQQAVAAISGAPAADAAGNLVPRPSGAAVLKELAQLLPPNTGFVLALDFERDSRTTTFSAFVTAAMKEAEMRGLFAAPADATPEAAAEAQERMKGQVGKGMAEIGDGLLDALARVGNVRLDALVLIVSANTGIESEEDHVAVIAKGLYDPQRIARTLKSMADPGELQEREVAGYRVFGDGEAEPAFCLLDANTLVLVLHQGKKEAEHTERLLKALAGGEKKAPKKELAAAFDLVTEKKARLAASGALSAKQKKFINTSLLDAIKPKEGAPVPEDAVELAGNQALLDLVKADAFTAALDTQGGLAAQAMFPSAAAATAFDKSSNKLQTLLFEKVSREFASAPPPVKSFVDQLVKAGALWKSEVAAKKSEGAGKVVTLKVNSFTIGFVPMLLLGMEFHSSAVPAAPPAPAPNP